MGQEEAFGKPGITPRWTSSSKEGVGTSLKRCSSVYFTLSHGIVNEIYFPGIDTAQTRDHQFLVSGEETFYEERRDTSHSMQTLKGGIPAYRIINEESEQRFKIEKTIFIDSEDDVFVEHVKFIKKNPEDDLSIYSLLAPHMNNGGYGNNAWNGEYKGNKMQFASKGETFLALYIPGCTGKMSCGFSGFSDGFQDIMHNNGMTYEFQRATDGNVAITTEIIPDAAGTFNVFIAFGRSMEEAAIKVLKSSHANWEKSLEDYMEQWSVYLKYTSKNMLIKKDYNLKQSSLVAIRSHVSKEPLRGAIIASLSIPWGNSKSDDDLGGYHLIWPRDMVEAAEALLILGDYYGATDALKYLQSTQESDGHWPQNMWLNGKPYWGGLQMDETAFPILLLYDLWKMKLVDLDDYRDMFISALSFIIGNGPVTDQDRWEEDGGYSSFTIAVEVSALSYGSEIAEELGMRKESYVIQRIADIYSSNIEKWLYRENSELDAKYGVRGHYVRISMSEADRESGGYIPIKNRPWNSSMVKVDEVISTGALSLVRFGLRPQDDRRIRDTLKIIDGELKVETKTGPTWHRYSQDGYGEHNNGSGFDGTGHGRGWPLLSGERAHYELLSGNRDIAMNLLHTMEKDANSGGMIPEQIWDSEDIPAKGLFNGYPSGSAMPLVWAHAEYVKLCWALENGKPFDLNERAYKRYVEEKFRVKANIWSFKNKIRAIERDESIIFITREECFIRITGNNWKNMVDLNSEYLIDSIYYVEVGPKDFPVEDNMEFTFFWKKENKWEGINFNIKVS
ncbi:MAG: glycoside hydrolase family 15 protein [Cuniculiplasma sp.]